MRLLLCLCCTATVFAAPCTTATPACTEWLVLNAASPRLMVYRSHALGIRNESITRALVVVHGGGRNAADVFRSALAAAFLAGAMDNTILVAPRFASNSGAAANSSGGECRDSLAPEEASWICEEARPDSWRTGGAALGHDTVTSYDFADKLLQTLARKDVFPNLRHIVLAGHSGGGQFTLRYAMANQLHEKVGIPVSYVVSNPDGMVYFDSLRPTAAAYPANAAAPGYNSPAPTDAFVPFSTWGGCALYNSWPYGLENRVGYTAKITDEILKKQLISRPVTYLVGGLDIVPLFGFDPTCPAMAQGPTRLARSIAYGKYMNEKFAAHHTTTVVPSCGHNDRCMYTADVALPLLFPQL